MKWIISLVTFIVSGSIGFILSNNFISNANQQASYYQTMQVANDTDRMNYLMSTSGGRTGINKAKIHAVDSVKRDELNKDYQYIERTREEYTMHTETYTTTDSKGNSTIHTRTYWSWDYDGSESKQAKYVTVNGFKIKSSAIDLPQYDLDLKDNMFNKNIEYGMFFKHKGSVRGNYYYVGADTRYKYSFTPVDSKLTLFAVLGQNKISPLQGENIITTTNKTVKHVKENYNESAKSAHLIYIVSFVLSLLLSIGAWFACNEINKQN